MIQNEMHIIYILDVTLDILTSLTPAHKKTKQTTLDSNICHYSL